MSLHRAWAAKEQHWGRFCSAFRPALFFSPQQLQQSQIWTTVQTSLQATHNIMVWVLLSFFTHFTVLNIFRQGNWRWEGRTVNLTTAQDGGPKQPRHEEHHSSFHLGLGWRATCGMWCLSCAWGFSSRLRLANHPFCSTRQSSSSQLSINYSPAKPPTSCHIYL